MSDELLSPQKSSQAHRMMLPERVYDDLPGPLQEMVSWLYADPLSQDDPQKIDFMLLSALNVIASTLYKVSMKTRKKPEHPPFYLFIVAKPGAGKGDMMACEYFARGLDAEMRAEAAADEEHKRRRFILSADSTGAAFVDDMKDNGGTALIITSEAQQLGNALSAEHGGNLETALLKAFYYERIDLSRKTSGFVIIDEPRLGVLMSGTEDSVSSLFSMQGVKGGLFSRFAYYNYDATHTFDDVVGDDQDDACGLFDFFHLLGDRFEAKRRQLYKAKSIFVRYTAAQRQQLVEVFRRQMARVNNGEINEHFDGCIRRAGAIARRILMTLATLRYMYNDMVDVTGQDIVIVPTDEDCQRANDIALTLLTHLEKHFLVLCPKLSKSEQIKALLLDRDHKWSVNDIANKVGCSVRNVYKSMDKLGLKRQ